MTQTQGSYGPQNGAKVILKDTVTTSIQGLSLCLHCRKEFQKTYSKSVYKKCIHIHTNTTHHTIDSLAHSLKESQKTQWIVTSFLKRSGIWVYSRYSLKQGWMFKWKDGFCQEKPASPLDENYFALELPTQPILLYKSYFQTLMVLGV